MIDHETSHSRRDFVKRAIYVPPAVVTLAAAPAYVKAGSLKPEHPEHPEHPERPEHPRGKSSPFE